MSATESEELIRYLKHSTDAATYERWHYLVTAVIYYSGMRNSEILALTPSCIEITSRNQGRIHVRRGWNRVDGFKSPKNGKERTVTISSNQMIEKTVYNFVYSMTVISLMIR